MVQVIYKEKKIDCEHLLGTFLEHEHYDTIVDFDCDLYGPSMYGHCTEINVVAKFRRNIFTPKEVQMAYDGLRQAATQSQNRGIAAGPRGDRLEANGRGGRDWVTAKQIEILNYLTRPDNALFDNETLQDVIDRKIDKGEDETRGTVWLRSKITSERGQYDGWFDIWLRGLSNRSREEQKQEAEYVRDNYISDTNYAQSVMSGVAGYYGRYPRIPYGRATSYTEKHPELFELSFPFLKKLNKNFKKLLPRRWEYQHNAAKKLDPRFLIADTVFTTLTVNHNWRSAAHLDAGDLDLGFSNLCTVTNGNNSWKGGYLVLPEYRVAVDLRPGDMLLVANHTAIHGNVALEGDDNDRLSIVAYFREDMLSLKSWEYENLRKQFVDERRLDPNHPMARKLWNGVSEGMWQSEEWAKYLDKHGMIDEDGMVSKSVSLEGLFE